MREKIESREKKTLLHRSKYLGNLIICAETKWLIFIKGQFIPSIIIYKIPIILNPQS